MTFSIVAHDPERGDWGVAVASKFPAVGAVVPWARAGAGAVATQAFANTDYGRRGLDLMQAGRTASEAIEELVRGDEGREERQAGIVDAAGGAATFTGGACTPWAGGTAGDGWACQGNILVGPAVVDAMAGAFARTDGELVDRLLAALAAGDRAGGDRRGRQSAALLVVREGGGYAGRDDRYIDLRVDDHPQATDELLRVFEVFDRDYLIRRDELLEATVERVTSLQRALSAVGGFAGEPSGRLDAQTRAAIEAFAGRANLEAKVRDDDLLFASLYREIHEAAALADETGA